MRSPADKESVRAPAGITGAPYTPCINVLNALRHVVGRVDLGELSAVLRGDGGPTAARRTVLAAKVDESDRLRAGIGRYLTGA
jgi:hypothetical protein